MTLYARVRVHLEGNGAFGASEQEVRANIAGHLRGIADRIVASNVSCGAARIIDDATDTPLGLVTFSFFEGRR